MNTMYNNLSQQMPYMYGYNLPQYQRMVQSPQNDQGAPGVAPISPYVAPVMMPQANYIKGRPVVSIDEARASQIDLDGSLYVFPDLGNKKIYTKQINMDGTASFNIFELSGSNNEASVVTPTYVTREELDSILAQLKESLIQANPAFTQPASSPTVKAQVNKTFNL